MTDTAHMPADLAAVAEACGMDVAEGLVAHHGGERLYVPKKLHDGHELIATLGLDRAGRLVKHCAGDKINVPVRLTAPAPADEILEMAGRMSVRKVARAARCSEDWVYRVLREARKAGKPVRDRRQQDFFQA